MTQEKTKKNSKSGNQFYTLNVKLRLKLFDLTNRKIAMKNK